jgi:hypothetical protein
MRTGTDSRLVGVNGMKLPTDWQRLGLEGKEAWLAAQDLVGVRAQASVLAAASMSTVDAVLTLWVEWRLITAERAAAALAIEVAR